MIKEIKKQELDEVLTYLEKGLQLCLYEYIDIKKYGMDNPNLTIYADRDEKNGSLLCVIMQYYQGLQIFSSEETYDAKDLVTFLGELDFNMINASSYLIDAIMTATGDLASYEREDGYVVELGELTWQEKKEITDLAFLAESYDEFRESAGLICSDEGLGGHYQVEDLADQLASRSREKFGRDLLYYQDGRLVCHVATYAEVDTAAVVSGVITHELARGQGLACQLVGALCRDLKKEGKRVFLFYYTPEAGRLYQKLGFANEKKWSKLTLKPPLK